MTTFYRNLETGKVQVHPVSGLGEFFNAEEVGEDGKAVKPFVALPITPDKVRDAKALLGDTNNKREGNK